MFCAEIGLSRFWAESEGQNPERDGRQNHRRLCGFASGLCRQKFVDQNHKILISLKSEVVILNQNSELPLCFWQRRMQNHDRSESQKRNVLFKTAALIKDAVMAGKEISHDQISSHLASLAC